MRNGSIFLSTALLTNNCRAYLRDDKDAEHIIGKDKGVKIIRTVHLNA